MSCQRSQDEGAQGSPGTRVGTHKYLPVNVEGASLTRLSTSRHGGPRSDGQGLGHRLEPSRGTVLYQRESEQCATSLLVLANVSHVCCATISSLILRRLATSQLVLQAAKLPKLTAEVQRLTWGQALVTAVDLRIIPSPYLCQAGGQDVFRDPGRGPRTRFPSCARASIVRMGLKMRALRLHPLPLHVGVD